MIIPVFSISSAHNALGLWHDENYALHQLGRDLAPDYASSILKRWFLALVHAGLLVPKPNHRYDYEGDHRDFVLIQIILALAVNRSNTFLRLLLM